MELTVETAYQAILNGAKDERDDPVHDWINKYPNRINFIHYMKEKDLDNYIFDFKIWTKCKHVLN